MGHVMKPDWLPALREMVRCYQAHERVCEQHFRKLGVTSAQFDIIATLGNTTGMTCKELGDRTLITKGTLTGVIDRLIDKGYVKRQACTKDRRVIYIALTEEGQELFESIFPQHLQYMDKVFERFTPEEWEHLKSVCTSLKSVMSHHIEES